MKQIFEKTDPKLADNPLIFPDAQFTKTCDVAPSISGEEEQKITEAFNAVING